MNNINYYRSYQLSITEATNKKIKIQKSIIFQGPDMMINLQERRYTLLLHLLDQVGQACSLLVYPQLQNSLDKIRNPARLYMGR